MCIVHTILQAYGFNFCLQNNSGLGRSVGCTFPSFSFIEFQIVGTGALSLASCSSWTLFPRAFLSRFPPDSRTDRSLITVSNCKQSKPAYLKHYNILVNLYDIEYFNRPYPVDKLIFIISASPVFWMAPVSYYLI